MTALAAGLEGSAELVEVDGRHLTFAVCAEDEIEVIGQGIHKRVVVDVARFDQRLRAKLQRRRG